MDIQIVVRVQCGIVEVEMNKLFKIKDKHDLEEAGLYDVCEWWIQNYPADIFPNVKMKRSKGVQEVVDIRELCIKILKIRNKRIKEQK
jgi:hypothetical protein